MLRHEVRYCTATDGTRIAYAIAGNGPPLVKVPTHLNHIGFDSTLVGARHWFEALANRNTLIWPDLRGAGFSDRDPPSVEFDDWVSDLDVVVNHLGLEQFALIGISMSGATSIAYAVLHPERVTHLILHAPHVRALNRHISDRGRAKFEAYKAMIPQFWDAPERWTRSLFADIVEFAPPEVQDALDQVRRAAISPELCQHVISLGADVDVTDLLSRVTAPTLITHSKGDNLAPLKNSQVAAARIPGARLVLLDARNHIVQEDEPGWPELLNAVWDFLGVGPTDQQPASDLPAVLTAREREVIALIAAGRTNAEIAEALTISTATAKTHIHNILEKLGMKRRSELAAYALREGLAR